MCVYPQNDNPHMNARWKPSVTVAAIIERDGRYLLVEEHTPEGLRLNNPAGHLEPGESIVQACAREALEETLTTQRVCYYSRSRQALWRKGETSGQQQHLKSAALDCDGDTLLLQVDQTGHACHTGRRSCFYVAVDAHKAAITSEPLIDPATLYGKKSP